jgi:hypothetical protein
MRIEQFKEFIGRIKCKTCEYNTVFKEGMCKNATVVEF